MNNLVLKKHSILIHMPGGEIDGHSIFVEQIIIYGNISSKAKNNYLQTGILLAFQMLMRIEST